MASEAQRLIGISLTKIAQSRSHRGGASLHKNLLVATVLQKARYIFMEEAYNIVHHRSIVQAQLNLPQRSLHQDKDTNPLEGAEQQKQSCDDCTKNQTENHDNNKTIKLPSMPILRTSKLKRRHTLDDRECEEVTQLNIPKRRKHKSESNGRNDSSSESSSSSSDEETDRLSPVPFEEAANPQIEGAHGSESTMEIEAITTKLVSVISFMGSSENLNNLGATDLCSSQAKDLNDNMQCSVITISS